MQILNQCFRTSNYQQISVKETRICGIWHKLALEEIIPLWSLSKVDGESRKSSIGRTERPIALSMQKITAFNQSINLINNLSSVLDKLVSKSSRERSSFVCVLMVACHTPWEDPLDTVLVSTAIYTCSLVEHDLSNKLKEEWRRRKLRLWSMVGSIWSILPRK